MACISWPPDPTWEPGGQSTCRFTAQPGPAGQGEWGARSPGAAPNLVVTPGHHHGAGQAPLTAHPGCCWLGLRTFWDKRSFCICGDTTTHSALSCPEEEWVGEGWPGPSSAETLALELTYGSCHLGDARAQAGARLAGRAGRCGLLTWLHRGHLCPWEASVLGCRADLHRANPSPSAHLGSSACWAEV